MLGVASIRMEGETAVLDTLPRSGGGLPFILGAGPPGGGPGAAVLAGTALEPPGPAQVADAVARYRGGQALRGVRAPRSERRGCRPAAAFGGLPGRGARPSRRLPLRRHGGRGDAAIDVAGGRT